MRVRHLHSVLASFPVLCIVGSSAACSVGLATDPQCDTNADCTARGEEFTGSVCENHSCLRRAEPLDPRWSCVGHVKWPPKQPKQVTFVVEVVELLSLKPPKGLVVKPCAKLDVTCSAPVGPVVSPGTDGKVTLTVESGFDGYFDIQSDETMPSFLYLVEPLADSRVHPLQVQVLTPGTFALLSLTAGFVANPARGTLVFQAWDCDTIQAPGVSFAIDVTDPDVKLFYLSKGLPTLTKHVTDETGSGGFVNLPEGIVEMTETLADGGAVVGTAAVQVRAGAVTYVDISPTP
jgi:hypothetical protein